jgi:hypothetical protein
MGGFREREREFVGLSVFGSKATVRQCPHYFRFTLKSRHLSQGAACLKSAITDSCTATITGLFDHFIGALRYSFPRKIAAGEGAVRQHDNVVKAFARSNGRRQPPATHYCFIVS